MATYTERAPRCTAPACREISTHVRRWRWHPAAVDPLCPAHAAAALEDRSHASGGAVVAPLELRVMVTA